MRIADHQVGAGDLKVDDGLFVRLVARVHQSGGNSAVFRAERLLFARLIVLAPEDGTTEEHAVSLSHFLHENEFRDFDRDVLRASERPLAESVQSLEERQIC